MDVADLLDRACEITKTEPEVLFVSSDEHVGQLDAQASEMMNQVLSHTQKRGVGWVLLGRLSKQPTEFLEAMNTEMEEAAKKIGLAMGTYRQWMCETVEQRCKRSNAERKKCCIVGIRTLHAQASFLRSLLRRILQPQRGHRH